jgi:hypothetical protein
MVDSKQQPCLALLLWHSSTAEAVAQLRSSMSTALTFKTGHAFLARVDGDL